MKLLLLFFCFLFVLHPSGYGQSEGFVQNVGQFKNQFGETNRELLFVGNQDDFSIQLYPDHFSYEIKINHIKSQSFENNVFRKKQTIEEIDVSYSRVEFYFENLSGEIRYAGQTETEYNYYGPEYSFEKVSAYQKVTYVDFQKGMDLEFIFEPSGIKYNIIVKEGADLSQLTFNILGGESIGLEQGDLLINTRNGVIREKIPLSYIADKGGKLSEVDVNYLLEDRKLRFETSADYSGKILTIDPIPSIIWGTYIGGPGADYGQSVAIDTAQNIYTSGFTTSTANIATTGALDEVFGGFADVFVMKHDVAGTKLWGTYYGGTSFDRAFGMTYSEEGFIYVSGNAKSPGLATGGVHQTTMLDNDDAFLCKLTLDGALEWFTYYGGDGHDFASEVTTDSNGDSYITGHTFSTNQIASVGAYKTTLGGLSNAFVAKFDNDGLLLWGTYFGDVFEEGWGIGCDQNDDVYVSGSTQTLAGIASAGTHSNVFGGASDAFLAKFDTDGTYQWGTYYGGASDDQAQGIAVTATGETYIAGITNSPTDIAYGDAYQPAPNSVIDGFVAKFNADGTMGWGTYVGGTGADYVYNLYHGIDSNIAICGMTLSDDYMTSPAAHDPTYSMVYDGFLISLDNEGQWRWGTYIGGELHDEPRDLAVDEIDLRIVVTGWTASTTEISTVGAEEMTYLGDAADGFISRFCNPITPQLNLTDTSVVCENAPDTMVLLNPSDFSSFIWSTTETNDTVLFDGLIYGTYEYYVDGMDTNGCQTVSDTTWIEFFEVVPPLCWVDPMDLCSDDTLSVWTDSGYVSYLWNSGGTDSLDMVYDFPATGLQPYYATVVDSAGCQVNTDTLYVDIWPVPEPDIFLHNIGQICVDDTVFVDELSTFGDWMWSNLDTDFETFYIYPTPGIYDIWVEVIDLDGCVGYDSISVIVDLCDMSVGEETITVHDVYPNPFSGGFNISSKEDLDYEIYNQLGQLIKSGSIKAKEDSFIQMPSMSMGEYYLHLIGEEGISVQKLVQFR